MNGEDTCDGKTGRGYGRHRNARRDLKRNSSKGVKKNGVMPHCTTTEKLKSRPWLSAAPYSKGRVRLAACAGDYKLPLQAVPAVAGDSSNRSDSRRRRPKGHRRCFDAQLSLPSTIHIYSGSPPLALELFCSLHRMPRARRRRRRSRRVSRT